MADNKGPSVSAASLERFRNSALMVVRLRAEHRALMSQGALPESPYAQDIAEAAMRHAYDIAFMQVACALDHVETMRRLLEGGVLPAFAGMTICRTAVEVALVALWILEPVERDQRRARGFAAMWRDLEAEGKFEACIPGATLHAPAKVTQLLDEATEFGLTGPDRNGRMRLLTSVPSVTELCSTAMSAGTANQRLGRSGERPYRYMSGYSHGMLWALAVGLDKSAAQPLPEGQDARLHRATLPSSAPEDHSADVFEMAVDLTARLVDRLRDVYGAK